MNKYEAGLLLAHAATFDNRHPSEAANEGWAAALHDVPYDDDARAAVARYYGTPPERPGERVWLQPHHVKSGRLAIRQERLGTTLPGYLLPAVPETGAEFVERRRCQIDEVASGLVPARPVPLKGGMSPELKRGLSELGWSGLDDERGLAGVGRKLLPEAEERTELIRQVRRSGPLGVECPQCAAPIGRPCKTKRNLVHGSRRLAAAGEVPSPETREQEEARRAQYLADLAEMAKHDPPEAREEKERAEREQREEYLARLAEQAKHERAGIAS